MKKKGIWIALLALVIAGGAFSATLAFFTDAKDQTNVFTMGNVDIALDEPKFEQDTNGTFEMNNITPGKSIDKDPTITVGDTSEDAYVRAKITYEGLSDTEVEELEKGIVFTNGWKKSGGYYYYNVKVSKSDVVNVFSKVVIPEQWGNEFANREFKIVVEAEAIQADNFEPSTQVIEGTTYITNWLYDDGSEISVK